MDTKAIHLHNSIVRNHEKQSKDDYGFTVDLNKNKWENAIELFRGMLWEDYKNRPRKMAYHNLCEYSSPPAAAGQLLGLGLKFCIQEPIPSQEALDRGLERFERDVRLRYEFADSEERQIKKKIYIKSTYKPHPCDPRFEQMIRNFGTRMRDERTKIINNTNRRTNLSKVQQNVMKTLRSNSQWIILMCNKNLGPAIMERDIYTRIKNVLNEHLMDGKTYRELSQTECEERIKNLKVEMTRI